MRMPDLAETGGKSSDRGADFGGAKRFEWVIDPESPLDDVFKKTWADRWVHGIAWPELRPTELVRT
jgi:hypothetical protein